MKDILSSIRRSPYQSLASFLVLFFAIFLSIAIFISLTLLNGLLGYAETKPQVIVYFQKKATQADIFKVRDDLVNSGKAASIKYVSKEDAFNIYKNLNKDKPLLLEMISANTFPASLEIQAKKPSYLIEISDFSKKQTGVDEVFFAKDISESLLRLTSTIRNASFILFAYLIFMSVIVLSTATLFKIAMKKDEIELLRLLGASKFYIKKPFMMESMFVGFLAVTTAFITILAVLWYLNPFLHSYLKDLPSMTFNFYFITEKILSINYMLITFGLALVYGLGIAFVASYIATEKYLS